MIGRSSNMRDSLIASTVAKVSIGDRMCQTKKGVHMGITPITDQDTLENHPALHRSSTDQAAA